MEEQPYAVQLATRSITANEGDNLMRNNLSQLVFNTRFLVSGIATTTILLLAGFTFAYTNPVPTAAATSLTFLPVVQSNVNMLRNSGFENGLLGWGGTARNYAKLDCSNDNDFNYSPKDGKCFAWFQDADGSSLNQDYKGAINGKYTAVAYVRGKGQKVTLALWRWCGGRADNTNVDVTAEAGRWKIAKISTPDMQNCTMLRWELYLKGDESLDVDNARLFKEY